MKKQVIACLLLLSLILIGGCTSKTPKEPAAKTTELNIAAAASLKDAALELEGIYKQKHPDVKLIFNFASSGTLQKQIEQGAPTDLFISAGKKQMDALARKNLIINDTYQDYLSNDLVLITGANSSLKDFAGLSNQTIKKVSIGEPETVPAGQYAVEALTIMKLYDKIKPKLVLAKDARQVLAYVESGNVDAGLVYLSDTYQVKNIKIIATAPAESHRLIVYPMAIIKDSTHQDAARQFYDFLNSPEAKAVFRKHQFKTLNKL